MSHTFPPAPTMAIIDALGVMTERFRTWTQLVTRAVPLRGTGNPEGVMDGSVNQFYVDDAGTAGSILYVKRDADIGGDRSQGWILV